jgi:glycine oxidase
VGLVSADRVNVVIVGGGIIGCSVAYYLSLAGARVTVLERDSLCCEASAAAAGLCTVSTREGLPLDLARESLRLMAEASQNLDFDFELRQGGSLALLRTEAEIVEQRAFVEKQRQCGVDIQILDRDETLAVEPAANPAILGGIYSPLDCTVNPFLATLGMAAGARRHGANFRAGVEVTGLKAHGGRIGAVVTRDGEVAGDLVVVAAGAWTPLITRTIGLDLPIEPSRGQMFITDPVPVLSPMTVKNTGNLYLCPTVHGNRIIGSMTEKVGFDNRLTMERLGDYAREAEHLVPALGQAKILRAWAGFRPLSPDNQALLGPVPGYDGLVMAAGHSRLGILYSAVTAKMVADLIVSGRTDFPMGPFNPLRFAAA